MSSAPKVPGPRQFPYLGSFKIWGDDPIEYVENIYKTYGDIARTTVGGFPIYWVNKPDYIHQILVKDAKKVSKAPVFKLASKPLIGQGILTSEGVFHHQQRQMVQPAFHPRRISAYADTMVDYTGQLIDQWQAGDVVDVAERMINLTMAIVAKTLFNTDVSGDAYAIGHAIEEALAIVIGRMEHPFSIPYWIPTPSNRRANALYKYLNETILKIIEERRQNPDEDKGDLLSMLLFARDEDGQPMSDQQVKDEAMTLFIAGHETTANALAWGLWLLSRHPEIYQRVLEEVDTVLEGRTPTFEDVNRLPYLTLVMKEVLRMRPPAWMMARYAIEPLQLGEYEIRAGSALVISPWVMHHSERFWDQPEHFIPERFLNEDSIPRFAYFPFGAGPRVCIGNHFANMEMILVMATLAQRVRFEGVEGPEVRMNPSITLSPYPEVNLRVHCR